MTIITIFDRVLNSNRERANTFVKIWVAKPKLPNANNEEFSILAISDEHWATLVPDVIRARLKQISAREPGSGALPDLGSLVTQTSTA